MRFTIIGLSVIFFILSVIIAFKTPQISVPIVASYQDEWKDAEKDVAPETDNVIKKLTEDQHASKALVEDLQMTIAQLEDQLATKEEVLESIKTTETENPPKITETETETETESRPKTNSRSRTLMVFGGGTFRSGQDIINDLAISTIENLVEEMSASPGSRVIIEGHTDNIPTGKPSRDNMDLSLLRAKAIANILITHGISSARVSEIGYGDTRPIGSNNTEEGRAKNRRVEVKLMPAEGEN